MVVIKRRTGHKSSGLLSQLMSNEARMRNVRESGASSLGTEREEGVLPSPTISDIVSDSLSGLGSAGSDGSDGHFGSLDANSGTKSVTKTDIGNGIRRVGLSGGMGSRSIVDRQFYHLPRH